MKSAGANQSGPPKLILALVAVVGLGVAQWWLWQFVRSAAEQLHVKQTEASQLADITKRIATINAVHQQQRSLLEQLSVSFPSLADTPQAIERLERLAGERGVGLTIRSIGDGQEASTKKDTKNKIVPLAIIIRATGSVDQLLAYLEAIEHVPELTALESWSLAPDPLAVAGAAPSYVFDGKVVFYLQP